MRRAAFLLLLPCLSVPAAAAEPDGAEIIRRADKDHRSKDERAVVDMVLVTDTGEKQRRKLELCTKTGEGEDDMNLIRFLEPATVRGTAVLTVEASDRADDQWLYLPALKKSKRIASSQKTQRFAGTDFTYEDLRTENLSAFTYERKRTEKVGDRDCWVVEARPKPGTESGYKRRLIFVDRERYLVLKVDYFDTDDVEAKPTKTLENRDYEQKDGLWRAKQARMTDHQRKTQTAWRIEERAINPGLPDSTFTVAQLERGL